MYAFADFYQFDLLSWLDMRIYAVENGDERGFAGLRLWEGCARIEITLDFEWRHCPCGSLYFLVEFYACVCELYAVSEMHVVVSEHLRNCKTLGCFFMFRRMGAEKMFI
jgi:hypothetical protein